MHKHDRVLGLLAVLAVTVYMLACGSRPAWSPDSNRVVFSFADEDSDTAGLAVYDLQTSQTTRIYETDERVLLQPLWLQDQDAILALAASAHDALDIIQINLATGESQLIKSIPARDPQTALMIPPVLADQRYLFFSLNPKAENSDMTLYRFDLKTNKLRPVPKGTDHYLFRSGSDYLYIAGHEKGTELGRFDIKSMRFERLMILDEQKYGSLTAGLAAKKNGKELAIVVKRQEGQKQETFEILILNRREKILKKIPLPESVLFAEGVHITYGPKESSLWIHGATPVEPDDMPPSKSEEYIFSLQEINVSDGSCSEILAERVGDEGAACAMQPSISPDGKHLAVSVLLPKDQERTLLYLVDLTTAERKVTKVLLPAKPKPVAEPQEQE